MRSDSVFDVIKKDGVIALYSRPKSLELFYLCKVKEFGVAQENLIDSLNHIIPKGSNSSGTRILFFTYTHANTHESARSGSNCKFQGSKLQIYPSLNQNKHMKRHHQEEKLAGKSR